MNKNAYDYFVNLNNQNLPRDNKTLVQDNDQIREILGN